MFPRALALPVLDSLTLALSPTVVRLTIFILVYDCCATSRHKCFEWHKPIHISNSVLPPYSIMRRVVELAEMKGETALQIYIVHIVDYGHVLQGFSPQLNECQHMLCGCTFDFVDSSIYLFVNRNVFEKIRLYNIWQIFIVSKCCTY